LPSSDVLILTDGCKPFGERGDEPGRVVAAPVPDRARRPSDTTAQCSPVANRSSLGQAGVRDAEAIWSIPPAYRLRRCPSVLDRLRPCRIGSGMDAGVPVTTCH
jgi:hypothetical protein